MIRVSFFLLRKLHAHYVLEHQEPFAFKISFPPPGSFFPRQDISTLVFFFNVQISFFTKTLNMSSFTHPHVIPNLFDFLYSFHGTRNVLLHKENACNPRPRSLSRARIACYYRDFRRTLLCDQVVSETWQLCCGCVIKSCCRSWVNDDRMFILHEQYDRTLKYCTTFTIIIP